MGYRKTVMDFFWVSFCMALNILLSPTKENLSNLSYSIFLYVLYIEEKTVRESLIWKAITTSAEKRILWYAVVDH